MYHLKKVSIILCMFLASQFSLHAQGFSVSGTVTDAEGEVLPGVNVLVRGATAGTISDDNGRFTITVPSENTILMFSFVGFDTREIMVGSQRVIDVIMVEDASLLEELVVVGYGTLRRSDVTGSIAIVSGEDLQRTSSFSALDGLRGVASGVNVFGTSGMPGDNIRVVIRGQSSIEARSEPLYVVDGVVMENFQFSSPDDIERVEVLKDASSTAIYGARGAQGVILVTTKSGLRSEGIRISYSGRVGFATSMRRMETLNSEEWLRAYREGMRNYVSFNTSGSRETREEAMNERWENIAKNSHSELNDGNYRYLFQINGAFNREGWKNEFDTNLVPIYDTDWQDEATRTVVTHSHSLTVQQGGRRSSMAAFLNYSDDQGVMLNTYIKRINARITYDANPLSWLSTHAMLRVNHSWQNRTEFGGGMAAHRMLIEMPAIFPVKWEDGNWANTLDRINGFGFESAPSPVHLLTAREEMRYRTQIFSNFALTFHLAEGLEFRTQFGLDGNLNRERDFQPVGLVNMDSSGRGQARFRMDESYYWQQENYLTWRKVANQHRINAMVGLSWQERVFRRNTNRSQSFPVNDFGFENMGAGSIREEVTSEHQRWAINSYFVRAAYSLHDKYMATFTARLDGSSKFGADNKYGFFPSGGLGWIVSSEDFMAGVTWVNNLKLHTSYGITGNEQFSVFQSLGTMNMGTVLIGGANQPSSNPTRFGNPDLRWEKTKQWDVGFDLNTFGNRLNFDISYYIKHTEDLLLAAPVPISSGFSTMMRNVGAISNRGWDIMISGMPVQSADFDWTVTVNANYNSNRVESLAGDDTELFVGDNWVGARILMRVGEPMAQFYGLERIGIIGPEDDGRTGIARRSAQLQPLGKGMPDWTGSFINRFRYKNFDLVADLQFVIGGKIRQDFYHSAEDRFGLTSGLKTILTDAWRVGDPTDRPNTVQAIRLGSFDGQNSNFDTRWLADASYLRGNMFQLGYTLPRTQAAALNISSLRVFASVTNLFVITSKDFQGFDPEGSTRGAFEQNVFFFQYPRPTTFMLGVNLTL